MARKVFSVTGTGRITVAVPGDKIRALSRASETQLDSVVRGSASVLAARIRANAPKKTGALRTGIINPSKPEKSVNPGKIVYDVIMDPEMNDTFVKITKAGKRYYYPASQEYGFRIGRAKRKPGLYYMRNTAVEFYQQHVQAVSEAVDTILEDL